MTILNLLVVIATVSTINLAYGLRLQRPSILSSRLQPKEASKSELQTTESSTDLNYDDMTVIRLREILRERGLPVSGLKGVLTSRLSENDASHNADKETHDVVYETKDSILDLLEDKVEETVTPAFRRGEAVKATVLRYGPLGASVSIMPSSTETVNSIVIVDTNQQQMGLILQDQIEYWAALNKRDPQVGEILNAYIQKIREDGKMDITLRPVGYDKVTTARDQLLSALEASANGELNVGDKSSPEEIWKLLPGLSKAQYKAGVGALLREGAITTSADKLILVPSGERTPMEAMPYSGKSPKGWRAPEGATLFVGNLAFSVDNMRLADALERRLGFGQLASVKLSTDQDSGRSKGFAHIDFFSEAQAQKALITLEGVRVEGREIRVDLRKRAGEFDQAAAPRDWGDSSAKGRRVWAGGIEPTDTTFSNPKAVTDATGSKSGGGDGTWCTVYVGNLAYKVTEESLRYSIESTMVDGQGSVADVRLAEEQDTGRKKGYAFVDFVDVASAERAVKELQGISVMGRPLKLDLEGMKQRGTGGGGERIIGSATGGTKFNEGENPVSRETRENRSFSSSFSRGGTGSSGRGSAGRSSGRGSYGRGGGGRSGRGDGRGRGRGGGRGEGRGRGSFSSTSSSQGERAY